MNNLKYPIDFKFNIGTLANDFTATDAEGRTVAYVRQKLFKLKEDIVVFSDNSHSQENYRIKANKWLDFNTAYSITDAQGAEIGKVARKGWKSLWKVKYEIVNSDERIQFHITEKNGWVKVLDQLLGEIPILSFFTGYLFNPTYTVNNLEERTIMELKKMPSFFGRKFQITKLSEEEVQEDRIVLSLMMMILLERRRG
jgi:uncharacterized protein YxjI